MNESKKFLVVGGGVGGLCVAYYLESANQNVTVIDHGINKSSGIAAGLINPLVFRRMTKSWRVDDFIPSLTSFYTSLESSTKNNFFHPIQIRRFFSSEQERDFWIDRQNLPEYSEYLTPLSPEDLEFKDYSLKNEYGSGRVKKSSWINTTIFIQAFKTYLADKISIKTEQFRHDLLNPDSGEYQDEYYDSIIFCEGFESLNNPWFSNLPIQPTKGEVLTIHSENLPENESINRKCFVLPVGNNIFKVGATYEWFQTDDTPSEQGKQELLAHFSYLSDENPEIIAHTAGIRPTSPDRRPIIGQHPDLDKLYFFNGLGTKGYMMAPLLASEFTEFVLFGKALDSEVNLIRYLK